MVEKTIEFLFQLAGAVVFWSEIFSTVVSLAATIYLSWKFSKVLKGDTVVPRKMLTN